MGRYRIQIKKSALKSLHKLPNKEVIRVTTLIGSLTENARPHGCKKLKGHKDLWRIRTDNYRITYSIEDQVLIVDILNIADRKDAYL